MNDSGSWRKVSVAISVSSLRATSANPSESAANAAEISAAIADQPEHTEHAVGECRAGEQGDSDHDQRLDDHGQRLLRHPAGQQRGAADRRGEQAVGHAAIEVLEQAHAGPARGEERGHDHDAGCEERDVVAAPEPGQVGNRLEQRPEQKQPDDRLHERDGDPPGLAPELAQVRGGHVAGVCQSSHRPPLFSF